MPSWNSKVGSSWSLLHSAQRIGQITTYRFCSRQKERVKDVYEFLVDAEKEYEVTNIVERPGSSTLQVANPETAHHSSGVSVAESSPPKILDEFATGR